MAIPPPNLPETEYGEAASELRFLIAVLHMFTLSNFRRDH